MAKYLITWVDPFDPPTACDSVGEVNNNLLLAQGEVYKVQKIKKKKEILQRQYAVIKQIDGKPEILAYCTNKVVAYKHMWQIANMDYSARTERASLFNGEGFSRILMHENKNGIACIEYFVVEKEFLL